MSTKAKRPGSADTKRAAGASRHPPAADERGEREPAAVDTVLRDASGEPATSGHNSSGASAETRRGLV